LESIGRDWQTKLVSTLPQRDVQQAKLVDLAKKAYHD